MSFPPSPTQLSLPDPPYISLLSRGPAGLAPAPPRGPRVPIEAGETLSSIIAPCTEARAARRPLAFDFTATATTRISAKGRERSAARRTRMSPSPPSTYGSDSTLCADRRRRSLIRLPGLSTGQSRPSGAEHLAEVSQLRLPGCCGCRFE